MTTETKTQSTRRFYLIAKGDEYRLTGFITETERDHHLATGWEVIKHWTTKPSQDAAREAAYIHSWGY